MQTHACMNIATCRDMPKLQYTFVNSPAFLSLSPRQLSLINV